MCGIFGLYSEKNKLEKSCINKISNFVLKSLNHRGPDENGSIFLDNKLLFCHTRLSIIDLANGKQPMKSKNGNTIIFNGEIVNFRELRNQLINDGENFSTNSDTEVILKLYEKHDHNLLKFIKGMFAFAIWNPKKKELFIARDHTGIKPLYYMQNKDEFYFSSEFKALNRLSNFRGYSFLPNEKLFDEYLIFGNLSFENTLYKNVSMLPPGHFLKYKKGRIFKKKYWEHFQESKNGKLTNFLSEKDILSNLENLLEKTFLEWSSSDVPMSILLSSGLDSNLINSIFKKKNIDLRKYCVIFPDNKELVNEKELLKKKLNLEVNQDQTIEIFEKDIPNNLEKLINHMQYPLQNFNSITMMKICEHIKKHSGTKVLFTGDGADELFAGYQRHLDVSEKYSRDKNPHDLILGKNFLTIERMKLFTRKKLSLQIDERLGIYRNLKSKDIGNKVLEFDQKSFLPGYLDRADKIGMMFNQEIRVPFCDDRIVNFANEIPWNMKISDGTFKKILKKVANNFLPEDLIWSKTKYKFNLPIYSSFSDGKLKSMYKDLINKNSKISKFYDYKGLLKLLSMHQKEFETSNDHSNTLSRILSLEIWLRNC